MVVKFNGKKLQGEATTKQRVLLARLEGKANTGKKLSKAEASVRITALMAKPKSKKIVKDGEATVGQRVFLARLEGKTNYGQKISFATASKRINKLLGK